VLTDSPHSPNRRSRRDGSADPPSLPLAGNPGDYWRPTAANYWGRAKKAHGLAIGMAIFGPRWERDHADEKKATLAAALETAFDPAKSAACIGFDQAARNSAAAWLPPGMAYVDGNNDLADPDLDDAARIDVDADNGEGNDTDTVSVDLPAFLTEDEPAAAALNGASAA
jgi:hypothetical protein